MARTKKIVKKDSPEDVSLINAIDLGELSDMQELKAVSFVSAEEEKIAPENFVSQTLSESEYAPESDHPPVGVFPLSETATIPQYATEGSACFDLRADFTGFSSVKTWNNKNQEVDRRVDAATGTVSFEYGDRAMIPTNLIFDIPKGYKILVYPRSGVSLKRGIALSNKVGVVDYDYVEMSYIPLKFGSRAGGHVTHGEALAQAELVPIVQAKLQKIDSAPNRKTTRNGGFGSTGV